MIKTSGKIKYLWWVLAFFIGFPVILMHVIPFWYGFFWGSNSTIPPEKQVVANQNGRYVLFEAAHSPTMLLDTQTGNTWKTSICSADEGLRSHADCWVEMAFFQAK